MPPKIKTKILDIEASPPRELKKAAVAVRNGAVAVFPTDTVYGIGASALRPESVKRIYSIKGRPSSKPLPILVDSITSLKKLVKWNKTAGLLAKKFWPGPVTLILRPAPPAVKLAGGLRGIGVRIPGYPPFAAWAGKIKAPLAATSANISGQPACRRAADAVALFDGAVEYILLGGDLPGTESSVLDLSGEKPEILREGAVSRTELERALKNENSPC